MNDEQIVGSIVAAIDHIGPIDIDVPDIVLGEIVAQTKALQRIEDALERIADALEKR